MIQTPRQSASAHRAEIFRALRALPHDDAYLGYLVTRKAKELGLVAAEKRNLKGNTLKEWSESTVTDGPNAPNAWACTAAANLLLEYGKRLRLSDDAVTALAYYLAPSDDENVFFQAKACVAKALLPIE